MDVVEKLERDIDVVTWVVQEHNIKVLHANHAVLMSVMAREVSRTLYVPFTVMPHGSAIEYAVRKDRRFHRMAEVSLRPSSGPFARWLYPSKIGLRLAEVF